MADFTRPRIYCEKCGMVEYCDDHLRAEFPPDATRAAMKRRHVKAKACKCRDYRYAAGVLPPRNITGQTDIGADRE